MRNSFLPALLLGTALASPALAADQPTATADTDAQMITVTGSILRGARAETALPITTITAESLQERGINTVADALQTLANNNAGALPTAFSANGAFAAGASGASLRGLTTSSTLVLFDGLRGAYYPLADDGTRNFVDLNTIPDAVIERIDVLKDGGSATYGADAVAGVINVVMKKQVTGLHADLSGGLSQRGDTGEVRAALTWGTGDLAKDGHNFYISGEYQRNGALYNRQLGFPYNTADLSSLCAGSGASRTCQTNGVVNGVQFDGSYFGPSSSGGTIVPVVRPYDPETGAQGSWQLLNPGAGCRSLQTITLNPAQQNADPNNPYAATQCLQDNINRYGVVMPNQERIGVTARGTVDLGKAEAYATFSFYQSKVSYYGQPSNVRQITPPGATGVTFDTRLGADNQLLLPVYVCPQPGPCTFANSKLNPNNPFAAQGQEALIAYRLADVDTFSETLSRTYRFATGVHGDFGDGWHYQVDATAMVSALTSTNSGYIYVQHLLDVVADGSYNFLDPSQNTQAVRNYLTPVNRTNSNSQMYQVQASLQKALFTLPGGDVQAAVGASWRDESLHAPSPNPDTNGPTERWFTINPVGANGHRTVTSVYGEVNAPLFSFLDVMGSGRYDSYSSGQHNFSPKFTAKFTPIKMLTLRGSWSRGFRIPSFAESGALPTTGYITTSAPTDFQAAHGFNTYGQNYNLGLTTVGTAGLQPEKSRNITAGAVFEPVPWLTLTADYYDIVKTNVIVGANYNAAIDAYYAGQPIPAGFTVTPDLADPQYPNAPRRIAFIQYGFVNANRLFINGVDLSATARATLPNGLKLTSSLNATHVLKYTQTFPDGSVQRYDGTLGPYVITSASGTPKWRATWANTVSGDRWSVTTTFNYTSGYENTAEDVGGTRGDCAGSAASTGIPATYRDGTTPIVCRTGHFLTTDLTGRVKLGDRFTVYANILNLFNVKPPYDPTTYGGYLYNPAWANSGIIGRWFRVGVKVDL